MLFQCRSNEFPFRWSETERQQKAIHISTSCLATPLKAFVTFWIVIGHTCDVKGFFTRRKAYYFRKIFRCEENLKEGPVEGDLEGEKKNVV